jgi:hypothetical protein
MAKLLKLRRGSTSDHGSFTGAEGEVTVDTTKDTLVVHDGSTVGGHEMLREDMSNLPAGTIDNADINASAAIQGTKISPNFGSQNITLNGQINIETTSPRIHLDDTDSEDDFSIYNQNGNFLVYNEDDNRADITVASDGQIDFAGNVDCNSGLDVTGDITVSGTVDGVDINARNTLFGGLTSSSGVLTNGVTATTQSASDNSTKVATTAYTDTAISNLVDSSPSTLNTLNELAAALGDDANFSTTVTNSIATKLPLAGGTLTGNVIHNDNVKAIFGTNSDLQIFHDGSSRIDHDGAGSLVIRTLGSGEDIQLLSADDIFLNPQGGNDGIKIIGGGAVEIYHNNSKRFETTSGGVSVTGDMTASGNVTAYSDESLKKDISTINNALSICGKLRGVSYKWIENDKADIGVVAQEVEKVIPEVVVTQTVDGKDIKSVDYGRIVGVLINAINEQQEQYNTILNSFTASIQELRSEIEALKGG